MSRQGRKAWNECYDIMQDHELTPRSFMAKVEIMNMLKKTMPECTDYEIALMLLMIADSNMREMVETL